MASRKPYTQLLQFAQLLGWRSLKQRQHKWQDEGTGRGDQLVTWYESGQYRGTRTDMYLMIAESPLEQTVTYAGIVYAIRYRICTGWHCFRLLQNVNGNKQEAERMAEWLHRKWFANLENRRQFRHAHPECTGYTRNRLRMWDVPYEVVDARRCINQLNIRFRGAGV